jgi:deoxyribonuclease V
MLACVDTYYDDNCSRTALLRFESWIDSNARNELVNVHIGSQEPYVPGEFFRRELPCIVAAIEPHISDIETMVIDGHVWLDQYQRKGLGAILYDALNSSTKIIGVAKNRFHTDCGIDVFRGQSKKPLVVTAAGLSDVEAATIVMKMHGQYRLPTLLKRADFLSRHGQAT